MTKIYKYDVFISHSKDNADSAQSLAAKLRQLDFYVWSGRKSKKLQSERVTAAMEDSAVCILLFGPGMSSPWLDECIWSAITNRIERTSGMFRLIPVLLTSILQGETMVAGKEMFLSRQPNETIIRFENGLEDDQVIQQLILRIRGIDSAKETIWSNPFFREKIRQRAKNVLNVDWTRLVTSLIDTKHDTLLAGDVKGKVCSTSNMVLSERYKVGEPQRKCSPNTTITRARLNCEKNRSEKIAQCSRVKSIRTMSLHCTAVKHRVQGSYLKVTRVQPNSDLDIYRLMAKDGEGVGDDICVYKNRSVAKPEDPLITNECLWCHSQSQRHPISDVLGIDSETSERERAVTDFLPADPSFASSVLAIVNRRQICFPISKKDRSFECQQDGSYTFLFTHPQDDHGPDEDRQYIATCRRSRPFEKWNKMPWFLLSVSKDDDLLCEGDGSCDEDSGLSGLANTVNRMAIDQRPLIPDGISRSHRTDKWRVYKINTCIHKPNPIFNFDSRRYQVIGGPIKENRNCIWRGDFEPLDDGEDVRERFFRRNNDFNEESSSR